MTNTNEMYNGKKIVIMGLGKSALSMAKLLHARGATVSVSEINPKENVAELAKDLAALKPEVDAEFGKHSSQFFQNADMVVLSPGVRQDTKPLDEVKARGVPVVSDLELLAREIEVPIIAITGTEGKTSVALLIKAMLEHGRKSVFYSGDHGEPLANFALKGGRADVVLLELSAFQLDNIQKLRPYVTVLTSLQAPFPERYPSADSYGATIKNVLRNLDEKSFVVYNFRDTGVKSLVMGNPAQKRVFRRKDPATLGPDIAKMYKGAWLGQGGREVIWKENNETISTFSIRNLKLVGLHNRDNVMAAVNVAKIFGMSDERIQHVLDTFAGIPHRLEFVKKKGGVHLYNDSRATTVDAVRKSLDSFPLDPIILISGGRDAQADFSSLSDVVRARVKTLILVGESKEHINRCLGDFTETFLVGTFEEAVLLSYQKSREGDIILLSPGCESYDMFVSYEERGNYFKKYVDEL